MLNVVGSPARPVAIPSIFPPHARVLEASAPPARRDAVRLLVSSRWTTQVLSTQFSNLADHLTTGDLLVVNDSGTLPAAFDTAEGITVHLSTCLDGYHGWMRQTISRWVLEPRHHEGSVGEVLHLPGGGRMILQSRYRGSSRLWVSELRLTEPLWGWLYRVGRPIRYPYLQAQVPLSEYQTIFATRPGSAEMPSAGRPFMPATLDALAARGVRMAALTLHTGVASLENHEPPYAEFYDIPWQTAAAVHQTRENGHRVVAVGTTVVRALESAPCGGSGWTGKLISPQSGLRVVDGLLTGLHEPQATHLAMLASLATPMQLRAAYQLALSEGYLWHEFGDLHLIV